MSDDRGAVDRLMGGIVPRAVDAVDVGDVIDRVDVDAIVQRVDVDAIVARVERKACRPASSRAAGSTVATFAPRATPGWPSTS